DVILHNCAFVCLIILLLYGCAFVCLIILLLYGFCLRFIKYFGPWKVEEFIAYKHLPSLLLVKKYNMYLCVNLGVI
uniref:hypothetical protein n=1 Tax=Bacteroides stercorirosoris TaxID=871324 RepID=UPI001C704D67